MSETGFRKKFEILKTLTLAKGEFEPLAKRILGEVAELLELEALSLHINFLGEKEIVIESGQRQALSALAELEKEVLAGLRKNYGVEGFHLSLKREGARAVFGVPVSGSFGPLGLLEGLDKKERNFAGDEEFLSALGIQFALTFERTLSQKQKEAAIAHSGARPVAPLEPGAFLFWARNFLKKESFNLVGFLFDEEKTFREFFLSAGASTAEEQSHSELDPHSAFGKLWGKGEVQLLSRLGTAEARFRAAGSKSALIIPVKTGGKFGGLFYLGSSVAIEEGQKTAVLEKLAAVLLGAENVLSYLEIRRAVMALSLSQSEEIKKERLAAIIETAIAVSHEVNNPLTAVIGNAQLVRLRTKDLPPDVEEKLKIIEEAAGRIQEVTAALMRITEPATLEYTPGVKMLDIFGSGQKEPKE
ncbi:MAG TPA: histidine kinase dimerization/phospho-acceptor domain-containing protein [Verrucomicrobiae bacterium]|nr:histidine kinase dimerization/phospho-acceptor domain-containing protein [Verrucomicrobiae bacterium]